MSMLTTRAAFAVLVGAAALLGHVPVVAQATGPAQAAAAEGAPKPNTLQRGEDDGAEVSPRRDAGAALDTARFFRSTSKRLSSVRRRVTCAACWRISSTTKGRRLGPKRSATAVTLMAAAT